MKLIIHIDGGARGNPGPAGAGVSICDGDGAPVFEAGFWLGRMTNNQAEYTALLRSLENAQRLAADELLIHSDSELMVKQINGEYRVKDAGLKPLFEEAFDRLRSFKRFKLQHVRREQNRRADELANLAMDAADDVIEMDASPEETTSHVPVDDVEDGDEVVAVRVRCVAAPAKGRCAAACKKGKLFQFEESTPAGLCMRAAEVVLPVVLDVRAGDAGQTVTCPFPGCGAQFSVEPA